RLCEHQFQAAAPISHRATLVAGSGELMADNVAYAALVFHQQHAPGRNRTVGREHIQTAGFCTKSPINRQATSFLNNYGRGPPVRYPPLFRSRREELEVAR